MKIDVKPAAGSRVEATSEQGSVFCRVPPFLSAHYLLVSEGGTLRAESAAFRIDRKSVV